MKRYDAWADARQVPPGAELETAQPARTADIQADVAVPGLQSIISGAMVGGVVVVVATAAGWDGDGWRLFVAVAAFISAAAWVVLLADTRRLLWGIERVLGADIDGDGKAGKPVDERLVFIDRGKARADAATARRADAWGEFTSFVRQLEFRGTSLAAWEPIIGRAKYVEYRSALLDYSLARWRSYDGDGRPHISQGWELTSSVDDILSRLDVQ